VLTLSAGAPFTQATRLPLILDETLGTSDDARAGVIIDAVNEIARDGRQVFYFSAQEDEVGKWLAKLQESGTAHKMFDLARIRQLSTSTAVRLPIADVASFQPPSPKGMSREEYGRTLNVPNIDPTTERLDNLHLWHVVDDVDVLHKLLCQRIISWGQLRTLCDHGGAGIVDSDDHVLPRVQATAKAIEAACRAWRIGQGKPVDRSVLQDSGCVSDTFMNAVAELAQRVEGDAEKILNALDQGEVLRWRGDKTVALREYFLDNGFLCSEEPLDRDGIRLRTLGTVVEELRAGLIDQATIDRIVHCLEDRG